jgi:DNA-binding transcriptional LysR family regulator
LDRYEIEPPSVSIVYPQGRLVPQKMRAFVDFAMPRLRERLALVATQCSV